MRTITLFTTTVLASVNWVGAFTTSTLPSARSTLTVTYGYVPSGLSAEEWKKIKEKEAQKAKNLGKLGPRGFKSRSFQSFQEALERGETTHLMPVENAKERLAKGELKLSDIPYMQRGGAWVRVALHGLVGRDHLYSVWNASARKYLNVPKLLSTTGQ
jgi:hypothetical protein